jgi:hypothetical protein
MQWEVKFRNASDYVRIDSAVLLVKIACTDEVEAYRQVPQEGR